MRYSRVRRGHRRAASHCCQTLSKAGHGIFHDAQEAVKGAVASGGEVGQEEGQEERPEEGPEEGPEKEVGGWCDSLGNF